MATAIVRFSRDDKGRSTFVLDPNDPENAMSGRPANRARVAG